MVELAITLVRCYSSSVIDGHSLWTRLGGRLFVADARVFPAHVPTSTNFSLLANICGYDGAMTPSAAMVSRTVFDGQTQTLHYGTISISR